jgi:hypothetical protein
LWDIDKRLDGYVSVYGLVGEKLVSYVEGRRALKPQPTYGKIEEGLNVPPDKRGALNAVIREIRKTVDRRKQLAKTLKGSSYHVGERPDQ